MATIIVDTPLVNDHVVNEVLDHVQDGDVIMVFSSHQKALFEMRAAGQGRIVIVELASRPRGYT